MRPPRFWAADGPAWPGVVLAPLGGLVAAVTARLVARGGWRASVPVLCVGNASVGGSGKTVVALDLAARLAASGRAPHVLLRGYGGAVRGVRPVAAEDPAALVGDEAKLLAAVAPTWVGADRAASARAAVAAGAGVLVLDDGLQNPGLVKNLSLLVVDGGAGFGNGRVLPAGPLREPVVAAAARCAAMVLIGEDRQREAARVAARVGLPVLRARLVVADALSWRGARVLAFAGIGRPEKVFASLEEVGAVLVGREPFPDHHPYAAREIAALRARAAALGAVLATTAKDAARLGPAAEGVRVLRVALAWETPAAVEALLGGLFAGR